MRLPISLRSSLFTCLLCTVAALPVFAANEGVVTMRDAVTRGIYTHPQYNLMANNRRATLEELRQARAEYRPSIDVYGNVGRSWTGEDLGADGAVTRMAGWGYQAGITISQMLFNGFETDYEVHRQQARIDSISNRVWETSEFLALDIVESYLNILRQRELLNISLQNVTQHEDIERQIRDSSSAGRTTEADLHQASARLASAKANVANVQELLRVSESMFISKVGGKNPDLMQRPAMPKGVLRPTIDDEVKQALLGNPTLASLEADIHAAQAEANKANADFYPDIGLRANSSILNDENGTNGDYEQAFVGVTGTWNLYRGGGDVARSREGLYRAAQAKETRAKQGRDVEEDVRKTWAQMIAAGDRAKQFAAQSVANEKVVGAYLDQFNLDRRTLLDVLDAQNEYFVARSNEINAQYVELFGVYRLLALKGQLLAAMDIAKPKGSGLED